MKTGIIENGEIVRNWKKIEDAGRTEYKSENLSFFLSEKYFLEDVKWHKTGFTIKISDLKICTGNYYMRDALDRLPDMLIFPSRSFLEEKIGGELLELKLQFRVHDLILERTIKANALNGDLEFIDRIKKNGPGRLRMQFDYESVISESERFLAVYIPSAHHIHEIWFDTPSDDEARDQDTHAIRRSWNTDKSYVEFGEENSCNSVFFSSGKQPFMVCELNHKSNPGYLYCQNYGSDFYLNENEELESWVKYSPRSGRNKILRPAKTSQIEKLEKDLKGKIEALKNEADTFNYDENKIRLDLINWKCGEFEKYFREANYRQCQMLINDLESILDAVKSGLSLEMPRAGELLYENRFDKASGDWDLFGLGRIEYSSENGIHIIPNVTINMWSQEEFSGDFLIDFDFFSSSEHLAGGTFLQLCARANVERDDYDFMCSATGHMPDYNFGISCYHLSFNRGEAQRGKKMSNVCNFRKTGKAFHLLSQITDPVPERRKWYHLALAKKDSRFLLAVNGKTVQEYIDRGYQGKILDAGKIGFRNWAGQSAFIKNLRISRIN